MSGTANDAYFKHIMDMGMTGPNKGKSGKFPFRPPGYKGDVPADYSVVRARSNDAWAFIT